ncbi:DUF6265 family protein [Glaciecola sp. 1036]|uniref:DUF6265 family protein n=1 Tax=Alteromonadaceae TaxID=72275 RepID=UPI003D00675C
MKQKIITLFFLALICPFAFSSNDFPNIEFLQEGQTSPKANLSAVEWLVGHWRGEAFGGIVEEVWSPPLGGSMMGAFKLVVNDEVIFYELETIVEENDSLNFRLKHFNGDLSGWEEKDKSVEFNLVRVTPNKVFFNGLTLEKISENELTMYVAIEDNDVVKEVKFLYKKIN